MNQFGPVEVVERFYGAVTAGEAATVRQFVEEHFHEDASISWPASLPYGGTTSGRSSLARVLAAGAGGQASGGPNNVRILKLVADRSEVAVELAFDWRSTEGGPAVKSGAIEWWTFDDESSVISIRAYYWDTAELVSAKSSGMLNREGRDRSR